MRVSSLVADLVLDESSRLLAAATAIEIVDAFEFDGVEYRRSDLRLNVAGCEPHIIVRRLAPNPHGPK